MTHAVTHDSAGGDIAPPSDWIVRWMHLLPPAARVLDVACGRGRHARLMAAAGHRVTVIDRDADALAGLEGVAGVAGVERIVVADLEGGPWPLPGEAFDAVVVTNYLWRALWPVLLGAVAPGGLWIHETFTRAHAALGRPRRPEFLLRPGELAAVAGDSGSFHVIAFEEGRMADAREAAGREIQRIVARRSGLGPAAAIDWLAPDR